MVSNNDWIKEAIEDGSCIAVTDGSYIKQVYPKLCANVFIMEGLKGSGRMMGSFAEASSAANAYRGELLGLMQVHLILLAVQRTTSALKGRIVIYLLQGCVSLLPPGRIPTRCQHSDVLKNILVNCSDFMFQCEFFHVKAHQDDSVEFHLLHQPAQLNWVVDASAKQEILNADVMMLLWQHRYPKEPICCFVRKEKMTSDTGPQL